MNQKIALFVIVATAIVAIAGFLLVTFLLRPADASNGPPGTAVAGDPTGWITEQRVVGGTVVNVTYDPLKQVAIVTLPVPSPELPVPPASETPPLPETPPEEVEPTPEGGTEGGSPGENGGDAGDTDPGSSGGTSGEGSSGSGAPNTSVDKVILVSYTVGPNDTLYSVAEYHTSRGQITSVSLMAKHGIDSTKIVAGATINVPYANPAYCPGLQPYVVLEGDNTFRIAQRAGTTPDTLRRINHLDANYTVYVTDVICLP